MLVRFGIAFIIIATELGGCTLLSNEPVDPNAYTLTYAMTTTGAAPPAMLYGPEGATTSTPPGAVTWSVDVAMTDDHDNPFVPQLTAQTAVVGVAEILTLTISWRREDAGLEQEVLRTRTYADVAGDLTIYGPLIP